jgi:hypothetical protein
MGTGCDFVSRCATSQTRGESLPRVADRFTPRFRATQACSTPARATHVAPTASVMPPTTSVAVALATSPRAATVIAPTRSSVDASPKTDVA